MNRTLFIVLAIVSTTPLFAQYTMTINQDCDKNGQINSSTMRAGHEFVDLGLPSHTMWSTLNLFATELGDEGETFYWGALSPKGVSYAQDLVNTPTQQTLPLEKDAASTTWGGPWRMPTKAECEELIANCTAEIIRINNKYCYKLTSNVFGYADSSIYICYATPLTWYSDTQTDATHLMYTCGYINLYRGTSQLLNNLTQKKVPIRPVFCEQ